MKRHADSLLKSGDHRVLITGCLAGVGGGEIAILRHLEYSTVPRSQISVALLNDGPLASAVRSLGIRCDVLGRTGRDGFYPGTGESLQIACRMARLIRRRNIGAVLCFGFQDLRAAMIARRLAAFRLCWRSQGEVSVFSAQRPPDGLMRRLVRHMRGTVDMVVPTTRWDAESLINWGVHADRVQPVYLGVSEDWFGLKTGGGGERVRLLMSGRLVPWKGQRTFLQALARIATRVPVEAWIVGDGEPDYRSALEAEARQLGVDRFVWFAGHRTDVRELASQCDIAVHCSEREPFGLVIVEGMAMGLPVVASRVEGPCEIVRDGIDGYLVSPLDVDALADTLELLCLQPVLRRTLGAAGRASALVRFRASLNVPEAERVGFGDGFIETTDILRKRSSAHALPVL